MRETELHLDRLAQTESVFALANGHIGLRANLDEGEPAGLPGHLSRRASTSCGRCPDAESGYGNPEAGQDVVNVTNGKLIRLLVDDEPFDVRYGRAAQPRRACSTCGPGSCAGVREWPPRRAARAGQLHAAGLASPSERSRPILLRGAVARRGPVQVVVQSELVANEPLPAGETTRAGASQRERSSPASTPSPDTRALLVHSTEGQRTDASPRSWTT